MRDGISAVVGEVERELNLVIQSLGQLRRDLSDRDQNELLVMLQRLQVAERRLRLLLSHSTT